MADAGNAVTEKIQRLRREQTPRTRPGQEILNPAANPSLPPSLRNILQLPEAPPPRPRPNLRIAGGRLRVPAGPAAPASWMKRNIHGASAPRGSVPVAQGGDTASNDMLPDSYLPDGDSLVSKCLIALAREWNWHKEHDQYYIATIHVRYKEAFLYYVSLYNACGIDLAGLNLLFLDATELEDATGAENSTHLDLSRSIGHSLKLSHLRQLLNASAANIHALEDFDSVPESWDSDELPHDLETPNIPYPSPRFSNLTHLSLARPGSTATWKGLLEIAPYLSTLTHLSLAHWPLFLTLNPKSLTAYRETPYGNVRYGASDIYSTTLDSDFSEPASILRRLSKSTYCLQWLDLTGCWYAIHALSTEQIDWCGTWRALETVKVGSETQLPECFMPDADQQLWRDIYDEKASSAMDRRTMMEWAKAESRFSEIETGINERIFPPKRVTRFIHMDLSNLWGGRTVSDEVQTPPDTGRTTRVVFDRGWSEWWIREAIEVLVKNPLRD